MFIIKTADLVTKSQQFKLVDSYLELRLNSDHRNNNLTFKVY